MAVGDAAGTLHILAIPWSLRQPTPNEVFLPRFYDAFYGLSLWLIGTVRAEPETVVSRAWVQSPDPAE